MAPPRSEAGVRLIQISTECQRIRSMAIKLLARLKTIKYWVPGLSGYARRGTNQNRTAFSEKNF